MQPFIEKASAPIIRISAALLLAVTWVIPAWSKLSAGQVPPGFAERFQNTFLASFPGMTVSYYSIAILEAVAGLLALASLASGEFLGRKGAPILKAAALLSTLIFIQLGFGLRLAGDNPGAASLFQYTVGGFVLLLVLDRLDQKKEDSQAGEA
jgi:hypothetical protein